MRTRTRTRGMKRSAAAEAEDCHSETLRAWRLLVGWFPLPPGCQGHHVCDWVLLDTDLAACRVCGSEHRCSVNSCPLLLTEDAEVCEITGYCVRSQHFTETSYSDNVIVESETYCNKEELKNRLSCVLDVVMEVLASPLSERCWWEETARTVAKMRSRVCEMLTQRKKNSLVNAHALVEQCALLSLGRHEYSYNYKERTRVAHTCSEIILRACTYAIVVLSLSIREHEIPGFVIGMLYLMRRGVCIHGIWVLPQKKCLQDMLVSENVLCRALKQSTKCITDTENRFKYVFRESSEADLASFVNLYADV